LKTRLNEDGKTAWIEDYAVCTDVYEQGQDYYDEDEEFEPCKYIVSGFKDGKYHESQLLNTAGYELKVSYWQFLGYKDIKVTELPA